MVRGQGCFGKGNAAMSQAETLLNAFKAGEQLTVAEALTRYGIYALSQRCGELMREGYPVKSEMVKVPSGKRVARYSWDWQQVNDAVDPAEYWPGPDNWRDDD